MFEFDPKKSKINKEKHGIDFIEAQALWSEIGIELTAKSIDEPRKLLIAKMNGKIWSAIFTIRNDRYRIISVRRARKDEEALYYAKKENT